MGRPRKTDEQKLLEGTYRQDRANQSLPVFSKVAETPDPPIELDELAKSEWVFICNELISIGILQSVDLMTLASYCQEMATYWKCQKEIKKGLTLMTPNGVIKSKPEVSIASQALNNAMRIASKFGFNPSDRQKLMVVKKEAKIDPISELLR